MFWYRKNITMASPDNWKWSQHKITRTSNPSETFYYGVKRCLDVMVTLPLLVLLLPVFGCIAIWIKLDSAGPVLFVQPRVGARRRKREGKITWEIQTFPFLKFRSMTHNADPSVHEAHIKAFVQGRPPTADSDDTAFKLTDDPRVTRAGRILRRTSLDELPQLFNVLRGEMSLVGPRPVPIYEVAEYQADHLERLAALPGITGPWQVNGRGRVAFEDMLRMDIDYVRQATVWMDVKMLLLTLPAILSGRGAA